MGLDLNVLFISVMDEGFFFCLFVCLNAGSPNYINSAWLLNSRLLQGGSRRNSETEAMDATPHGSLVFHPPELPEDTLMEVQTDKQNDDIVRCLRYT